VPARGVKILAQELAGDAVMRERFAREAALAGRLGTHHDVVTAYEADEWQHRPTSSSSTCRTAASRTDSGRKTARRPGRRQCDGSCRSQMRSTRPRCERRASRHQALENLLLAQTTTSAVADFGVSRRDGEIHAHCAGEVVGTAGYLAPEQVDGRGATAASDRFALGSSSPTSS
jgi:serine/threonine-protein kinase